MKCVVGLCLLVLASSQLQSWQESDEDNRYLLEIIIFLDKTYHFKSFVTFMGNQELSNQCPSLQQSLMETLQYPVIVAGLGTEPLQQMITSHSLVIILFTGLDDPMLKAVHESLVGLQHVKLIFVYKSVNGEPPQTELIESIMRWNWEHRMVYSLLMYKNQSHYEEWTFASLDALNTMKLPHNEWFRSNPNDRWWAHNLRRYNLLVPVFENVPEAFMYNSTGGKLRVGGIAGRVLGEFLRFANATMDVLLLPGKDNYEENVRRLAGNRSVELGANLLENNSLSEFSPLIINSGLCLIVPFRRPSPMHEYIGGNRTSSWPITTVGFIVVYTIIKRLASPRSSLFRALEESTWSFIGIPLGTGQFNRLSLAEKFMEVSLQLFNVCFLNIVSGFLATRLTSGVFKPEINDVKSFMASGLPIMIDDHATQRLFEENRLPYELKDRLLMVSPQTLEQSVNNLNTSNAYVMDSQQFLRIAYLQEFLRYPKLKMGTMELCTASHLLRLPVSMGSPFKEVLFYFFQRIKEVGLYEKFVKLGLEQGHQLGRYTRIKEAPVMFSGLTLDYFRFAFILYMYGILLAFFVLYVELRMKRYTQRRDQADRA